MKNKQIFLIFTVQGEKKLFFIYLFKVLNRQFLMSFFVKKEQRENNYEKRRKCKKGVIASVGFTIKEEDGFIIALKKDPNMKGRLRIAYKALAEEELNIYDRE